jgi:hypothetical protein
VLHLLRHKLAGRYGRTHSFVVNEPSVHNKFLNFFLEGQVDGVCRLHPFYSSRGGGVAVPKKFIKKKKNMVVIRTRNASRAFIIIDPLAQTKGVGGTLDDSLHSGTTRVKKGHSKKI